MEPHLLDERKKVVADWIEVVFNAKHLDGVERLKTSAYLDWTPFPAQRHDLPISGLKQSLPDFLGSFPDFHFTADQLIAEGEFVVSLGHWNGTHQAPFMGIPAKGQRLGGTRIDIFRVINDKMVEHWGCGAELSFLGLLNPDGLSDEHQARSREPGQLCRDFLEHVINQRNFRVVPAMMSSDAFENAAGALLMSRMLRALPDYQLEIGSAEWNEGEVEITSAYSGTHTHELFDLPATGRRVSGSRTDRFTVADGKITESWLDWDVDGIRSQLKVEPS